MNLQKTIDSLLEREGGYINHPSDRGGPTNWGITETVARAFGYTGDMRVMPRQMAFDIYVKRYWIQPRFDQVAARNAAIAEELLDTGVNMGTVIAGRFLQRALNALNRQGSVYPDVSTDGVVGAITLAALDAYIRARGTDGVTVLLRMLNAQQSVRYMEIAERDQKQEDFQFGWQLHRVT